MQNSGQYGGVSDSPQQQFVAGRPHIFSISHDSMPVHYYGHPSLQQIQQHPQFSQLQQQEVQLQQQREREREREQQAAAQQAMVQQLGLGGGPDSPSEVPSPGVSRPSPKKFGDQQQQQQQLVVAAVVAEDDGMEDEGRSAGGNRWPRQETLALIKIRSEMDSTFRDSGLKGPLWEEVSRKLAEQGYSRTAKKCKEKFENVHKYYKKTKDGKAGRQDGKSYRFFSQLEALYCGQEAAMQLGSRLAASAAASLLTDSAHAAAAAAAVLTGSAAPAAVKVDNGMIQQQQQQQQQRQSEVTLSESMSEDEEDFDEVPSSKKRKRGEPGVKQEDAHFSALMKNLVEKQESMQQRFLEFMERREQERQARDELWRRQELARVAREHELRVQEQQLAATRDAALVAFLQRVTGQTLSLPQIPPPPAPPSDVTPSKTHTPLSSHQHQQLVTIPADAVDDSPIDPNSKRWPKPEVLTLIKLRSDMEPRFQEPGPKAPLWEEISQGMACLGYNRNQKRCKEKWENINKYFRKTKESNKKRPENAKTCPYFHQLELLYTKGVLGTVHKSSKPPPAVDSTPDQKVDHQAVPLAQRIEAAATPTAGTSSELKMLPAAAAAAEQNANSGNGFSPSPENGSSGAKAHVVPESTST